ncbi:hypothetical protein LN042_12850 [Kitasatospora sp. RB6PN24]|uniref:hypothetical protein n=1 Tax=Kitasatospora humi TaxID=2893891 RepID=UPI001E396B19|nr:hypothetical protein [Kitasatospora humi]MCC9307969.1 hypothetical protein [Kitasatospora humi]
MTARREPIASDSPEAHAYTEAQVDRLIRRLQERGSSSGLLWGSARTNGTANGRVLVNFGNAPVSTLLNLLNLLNLPTDAEAKGSPCES